MKLYGLLIVMGIVLFSACQRESTPSRPTRSNAEGTSADGRSSGDPDALEAPTQSETKPDGPLNDEPTEAQGALPAPVLLTPADRSRTVLPKRTHELWGHAPEVIDVAFSADGRRVATVGGDRRVKISDAKTGQLLYNRIFRNLAPRELATPGSVTFSPNNTLLAVGSEKEINLLDAETGKFEKYLSPPGADFKNCVRFTPTGDRLVSLGYDGITVWSMPDGALQNTFEVSGFYTDVFALTPDGNYLALDGENGSVDLFDLRTGKIAHRFSGAHESQVACVAINADGSLLVSGDRVHRLVVFDLKKKVERFRAEGHGAWALAFSPDGLLAVGNDGIELFVVGDKQLHQVGSCSLRSTLAVGPIAFSPDGTQMIATARRGQRRADLFTLEWSLEDKTLATQDTPVGAMAASNDGRWLAWVDEQSLVLYSVAEDKTVAAVQHGCRTSYDRRTLDFSPDSSLLVARLGKKDIAPGDERTMVGLYTLPDLEPKFVRAEDDDPEDVRFTPDGKQIVLFHWLGNRVWNVATNEVSEDFRGFAGEQARFARDKPDALFTAENHKIRVHRWPGGEQVKSWYAGHEVTGFAVSPDGALVATCHPGDKRACVWDGETGELVAELEADPEGLSAVAFSTHGRFLITGGKDTRLKIWSCDDWQLRASLAGHFGETLGISCVPKSAKFVTAGVAACDEGSTVKQWNLAKLLEIVPAREAAAEQPQPRPTGGVARQQFKGSNNRPAGVTDEGSSIYFLDYEDHVRVCRPADGEVRWSLEVGEVNWVEFSPDGLWLAASYGDWREASENDNSNPGVVKIWDRRTQKLHHTLTLDTSLPERMDFSPDGRTLAVASGNYGSGARAELSLWDVATGERTQQISVPPNRLTHVKFSPDGTLLAFGGCDDHVTVWDVKKNQQQYRHELEYQMQDLQFSPDGKLLAVCGGVGKQGKIQIFVASTGKLLSLFKKFDEETVALAFSPQGDVLAAACLNDRSQSGFCFWSLPDGKEIRRLITDSPSWGRGVIFFSPDGKLLAENVYGLLTVWRSDHLLDLELQRQIEWMQDRNIEVTYKGDLLHVEFPYEQASNRNLENLPVVRHPFILNLGGTEAVTDAGMQHLAKQTNLAGLDLSSCSSISVTGLAHLQDLPLRVLDAAATKLDNNEALAVIGRFESLETLTFDWSSSDDVPCDPTPLANLSQLRELEFSGTELPAAALATVAQLTNLETLKMPGIACTDGDLQQLAGLEKLRELEVGSSNEFTGAGLAHLAAAKHLEVLRIGGRGVGKGGSLEPLRQFTWLRELEFRGFSVDDEALAAIAALKELEIIGLPEEITDAGLAHLAGLTRLRRLDLSNGAITDAGLLHLANLDALEELILSDVAGVTGSGLAAFAGADKLTRLVLDELPGLTDDGLQGVAKMTQLERLYLPPQTTDAGLAHLVTLQNLCELQLDRSKVTDAGLAHLAKLPNLDDLSLDHVHLTEAAVPQLAKLRKLRFLSIHDTGITPQGIEKLKKSFPEGHYLLIFGP